MNLNILIDVTDLYNHSAFRVKQLRHNLDIIKLTYAKMVKTT